MLRNHNDYNKALELTNKIALLNARVQSYLLKPHNFLGRDDSLAQISDELEDRTSDLYKLLKLGNDV